MDEQNVENLNWFFGALEPIESAYADPEFSFLVHDGPNGTALLYSRLVLQPLATEHPDRVIEAGNFYGFSGHLRALSLTPRELIRQLLDGYVPAPDRTWRLSRSLSGRIAPSILRNRTGVIGTDAQQQKIYELFGYGLSDGYNLSEEDDWSLRGGVTPFSSVNDLILSLRLQRDHQFHMIAFPPLVVDRSSRVRAEVAELKLRCSKYLPREKICLGIVVSDHEGVKERTRIPGDLFKWEASDQSKEVFIGTVETPVRKASVVHCLAVFDQQCLDHFWVGDPDAYQNPLRTIYEAFDPDFEDASAMLMQQASKGQSSAQESSVAALLWVLGFAPLHLGRLTEAPDVIAVSRDGHLVVVECTLSDLQTKKQNKPQKLLDRTNQIRAALERSNAGGAICIPVMVTSRKRADIEEDIADCERRGIVVFTQEDIEPLIISTINLPQSDVQFGNLKQRLDCIVDRLRSKERQEQEMAKSVEEMKKAFAEVGNKLNWDR